MQGRDYPPAGAVPSGLASRIQDTSWFKPGAPASLKTHLFCFDPVG